MTEMTTRPTNSEIVTFFRSHRLMVESELEPRGVENVDDCEESLRELAYLIVSPDRVMEEHFDFVNGEKTYAWPIREIVPVFHVARAMLGFTMEDLLSSDDFRLPSESQADSYYFLRRFLLRRAKRKLRRAKSELKTLKAMKRFPL